MCANNPSAFRNSDPNASGSSNLMAAWITAAHDKRKGGLALPSGGTVAAPGGPAGNPARFMAVRHSASPQLDNRLGV